MAQLLLSSAPAFILACMGTDNKFTAEHVLKSWQFIQDECIKRGITIVSFGADGDSRELKGMRVASHLMLKKSHPLAEHSPARQQSIRLPKTWFNWFAVRMPSTISCVQDTVHIAVKLKARLLKPSIVLPLGSFVAGAHHIKVIRSSYSKGEHGLRDKDLNHKDRQNFEAVNRITSTSVISLLEKMPDALGTIAYLRMTKDVSESFLDTKLHPLDRIEKIWCAVFFLRYWRQCC